VVALLFVGCTRATGPVAVDSLIGLDAPLIPGPGLRVSLPGQVFERPAEVLLDVAAPMTLVTATCLDEPLIGAARVKVVEPMGGEEVFPVTRLAGLSVSGVRLAPMQAGLVPGSTCVVVLGMDVLADTALRLDVTRRLLRFRPSQPREAWVAEGEKLGGEVQVLELTRDPIHEWPLLAAQLRQGAATFTGTFVLSTRERTSRVFEASVSEAGLESGAEQLRRLPPLPAGLQLPVDLTSLSGLSVDRFELAPGVGAHDTGLLLEKGRATKGVVGVIAADLFGRFEASIDVSAGVLFLHRPRLLSAGARFQCARGDASPTEDACFELEHRSTPGGVLVSATVWRPLPEGGRLSLDLGEAAASCRVGLTFERGDRGRSTQHLIPWARLLEVLKPCAKSLSTASTASLALFEDSALKECPGVCAFALDLRSGRVSCECQPTVSGLLTEAEKALIDHVRDVLKDQPAPSSPEPADPTRN